MDKVCDFCENDATATVEMSDVIETVESTGFKSQSFKHLALAQVCDDHVRALVNEAMPGERIIIMHYATMHELVETTQR